MSIELKDVAFEYDELSPVLAGLNMSIAAGERVAIVGQNGAGKTTTVKLMNGLLKPTRGSVLVNGTDTAKMTNAKMAQTVAYVFQNPDDQLFQSDVYSELAYIPKYLKWGKQDTEQRLERAISMTGIRPFVDDNPADLPTAPRRRFSPATMSWLSAAYSGQLRPASHVNLAWAITWVSKRSPPL